MRQASPAGWVDAQACSWNQAYQAAQTGDLILVKGGNYGNVSVGPNKPSIAAPGVTFRTASGETVTVNDFENGHISGTDGGNNISLVGPVSRPHLPLRPKQQHHRRQLERRLQRLRRDPDVPHRGKRQRPGQELQISDNKNNSLIWINGSNLSFENNVIHDAGLPAGSGAHTECMYVWDVTNLTLKRNHFYHCSVMDVFITGSNVANGGMIENNVFEKPWSNTGQISNSALAFHFRNGSSAPTPDPNNWDFRYNTFVGPLSIEPSSNPVGSGGMRVMGNVFLAGAPCGQASTTYAYNAFVSGACGTSTNSITNSLASYLSGFTSTASPGNYSLLSGSILRDRANPTNYPSNDRAGTTRYTGPAPDIGAYEGP